MWLLYHDQSKANLRERVMYRGDVSSRETRTFDAGQPQLPRVRTEQARKFFIIEPLRMNVWFHCQIGRCLDIQMKGTWILVKVVFSRTGGTLWSLESEPVLF